jgi:Bacteriophage clamp loader A subunit
MAELKDYMNSINQTKENIIRSSDSPDAAAKQYPAFVAARSLSYHQNLIHIVNELNMHPMGNQEHFEFLLNIIPKGRRFVKWSRPENEPLIKAIMDTQGMTYDKAKQIAYVLTTEQIESVCKVPEYGGVIK